MLFSRRKSRTGSLTFLPEDVLWVRSKSRIELKITYYWFFWAIRSQVFHSTAGFTLHENAVAPYLYEPLWFLKSFLVRYLIWSSEHPCVLIGFSELQFLHPKRRMCGLPELETGQLLSKFPGPEMGLSSAAPFVETLKLEMSLDLLKQYLEIAYFIFFNDKVIHDFCQIYGEYRK